MNMFIKKLIKRYTYDWKLKTKLLISHTILILLPAAVLSGFLYVKFYDIVIDDTIRSEQALSAQTAASIESFVSHINTVSDTLTNSATVHSFFNHTRKQAAHLRITDSQLDSLFRLVDSLIDHASITGIRFYYDDTIYPNLSQYNKENSPLFIPISSVSNSRWHNIYNFTAENRQLFPECCLTLHESEECGTLAYITRVPYIADHTNPVNPAAYAAIYFSEKKFTSILSNNVSVQNSVSYIINNRNELICASDMELAQLYSISHGELKKKLGKEKTFSLISDGKIPTYAAYFPIANTDWDMVSLLPANHITDAGNRLMLQFIFAYLLFTAIALFISLKLFGSIADRIIAVAYQMETVRTGRPCAMEIKENGCDEIGVLTDTYNYMTEEINCLMDSQEKSSEDLRMAEFRALQAQINPHFLYNTLDMINWLSQTGRKEEVTTAVQTLSRFYKLTLNKKGLLNTVKDELEHVSLYAQLQNMRYDNCGNFVVDVPDELFEYTIPKLTFQPLVENAFLHGIMAKESKKGNILLTGWLECGDMVFVIADDGVGISPEELADMVTDKAATPENGMMNSNHIGVYNTHFRLKSLYGESYGLSFSSQYGKGTEVVIRLPAKRDSSYQAPVSY